MSEAKGLLELKFEFCLTLGTDVCVAEMLGTEGAEREGPVEGTADCADGGATTAGGTKGGIEGGLGAAPEGFGATGGGTTATEGGTAGGLEAAEDLGADVDFGAVIGVTVAPGLGTATDFG